MANKPAPRPGATAAYSAIKKRYGTSGWGAGASAQSVYDVVRESTIVQKYGAHNAYAASALIAGEANSKKKK